MGKTAATPQDLTTEETSIDTSDTLAAAVGPQDPELKYGDHLNQKFGNTPANPKHAPNVSEPTELMVHTNNNMDGSVGNALKTVPKEMVGDYARAGWSLAGPMDRSQPVDVVGPGAGATKDEAGAAAEKFTEDVASGKAPVDTAAADPVKA